MKKSFWPLGQYKMYSFDNEQYQKSNISMIRSLYLYVIALLFNHQISYWTNFQFFGIFS